MNEKQNPALAGASRPGSKANLQTNDSTRPLKWKRVLRALASGRSFHRFEAERELHDHSLHSTVSTIQSKGIAVARRWERVPGFMGIPTDVCRYWLEPEAIQAAKRLLGIPAPTPEEENAPEVVFGGLQLCPNEEGPEL